MWKNQTVPNLTLYFPTPNFPIPIRSPPRSNTHHQQLEQNVHFIPENGSFQYQSKQSISFDLKNQTKNSLNQDNGESNQLHKKCSQVSMKTMKDIMLIELQENQQLRINLFKAEKTIKQLHSIACSYQIEMMKLFKIKKQEPPNENIHDHRSILNEQEKIRKLQTIQEMQTQNQYQETREAQFIKNFIKEIIYLSEHYKSLQINNDKSKKQPKRSKTSEQKLSQILQQFNVKLMRSEQMIQKLITAMRQKDSKIEQYQQENRNINIKIIDQKNQIQKLKRLTKQQIGNQINYYQIVKNLQNELQNMTDICREYEKQLMKYQKMETIHVDNQRQLHNKIEELEDELRKTQNINNELIDSYQIVSAKIECNEERFHEMYQNSEIKYEDKVRQYEKQLNILKKEREMSAFKLQQKVYSKTVQIEKLTQIKISLQTELLQRTSIINELQQELKKYKDKQEMLIIDAETRIQQKQQQICYLEQIKKIGNHKHEELTTQLQDAKCDMITILEQLKVKQLQILKFKEQQLLKHPTESLCNNCLKGLNYPVTPQYKFQLKQFMKNEEQKLELSKIMETEISNSSSHKFIDNNEINLSDNFVDRNSGIIWKKLKRNSAIEDNNNEEFHESVNKMKILADKNINKQMVHSFGSARFLHYEKSPKTHHQDFKQNYYKPVMKNMEKYDNSLISMPQLKKMYQNQHTHQSPIQNKITPRNKFSLQAFQNRMGKSESQMYQKQNKSMLR